MTGIAAVFFAVVTVLLVGIWIAAGPVGEIVLSVGVAVFFALYWAASRLRSTQSGSPDVLIAAGHVTGRIETDGALAIPSSVAHDPLVIRHAPAVFRSSVWARGYLIMVGTVGTLLGLSGIVAAPDAGGRIVGAVMVLPCLWFTVRATRAGVHVSSGQVRIRGLFRSKTIARDSISEIGWSDSGTLLPWKRLTLRLDDGKVIEVPELSILVISDRGHACCAETHSSLHRALGTTQSKCR